MLAPSLDSTASNSFAVLLGGTGMVSCLRIGPTSNLPKKSETNKMITDNFLQSKCLFTCVFIYHKNSLTSAKNLGKGEMSVSKKKVKFVLNLNFKFTFT